MEVYQLGHTPNLLTLNSLSLEGSDIFDMSVTNMINEQSYDIPENDFISPSFFWIDKR